MALLQITISSLDTAERDHVRWVADADFVFRDGELISTDGGAGARQLIDFNAAILDPDTGDRLTFIGSGERWLRNLPQLFRAGDTAIRVEELAQPVASRSVGVRRR